MKRYTITGEQMVVPDEHLTLFDLPYSLIITAKQFDDISEMKIGESFDCGDGFIVERTEDTE